MALSKRRKKKSLADFGLLAINFMGLHYCNLVCMYNHPVATRTDELNLHKYVALGKKQFSMETNF